MARWEGARVGRGGCGAPLSLGELEAETIEHELMIVGEDAFRTRLRGRE